MAETEDAADVEAEDMVVQVTYKGAEFLTEKDSCVHIRMISQCVSKPPSDPSSHVLTRRCKDQSAGHAGEHALHSRLALFATNLLSHVKGNTVTEAVVARLSSEAARKDVSDCY